MEELFNNYPQGWASWETDPIDEDFTEEVHGYALTEEKCPRNDCRGKLLVSYHPSGSDDYYKSWKCDTCDFEKQE